MHPLEQRIARLRARVRRLVLVHCLGLVLAAVLAALLALGLSDYLIRFQDRGLRVIWSLLFFAALGWAGYRFLYRPMVVRLRDIDLALRVQGRYPALEDRLLSAVEFLRQSEDDSTAGSPALRRAVIAQATAETDRLDLADVLDARRPARAAVLGAIVVLAAAVLVVLNPVASRIAVARLVNPFGDAVFPRKNHLQLRSVVTRVARGQDFAVEVIDARGAKLPPEVRIRYRFEAPDGTVTEESAPMRFLGKAAVARRENVVRPFSYRVEGGDDDLMPWIAVDVVEPPSVASLGVRLVPPEYTGWPAAESDPQIRALVGTRIEISGQVTKPLRSAEVCLEGDRRVPCAVSSDGYRIRLPAPGAPSLLVEQSGAYWFELVDREGLEGGAESRWEIRAVPDNPPSAVIEQPTANIYVTSRAVVPLRVTAKDDLLLRQVELVFSRSDRPDDQPTRVPLYRGPQEPPAGRLDPAAAKGGGPPAEGGTGDLQVVEYRWELAGLELPPGTQVNFHAVAGDYLPQSQESEPRRLTVITPEELQDRIAGRQKTILAELERVLRMQRGSREQVEALRVRLAELGRLDQLDVDRLQAAELNQRQVRRTLTSRGEGVPMHVLALLADLENNQVDSPEVQRRMEELLAEIDRLEREHLPQIGSELTSAIKDAQVRLQEPSAAGPDGAIGASLAAAAASQQAVIASLEEMLRQLAQWDNYRKFYREISQLLRDQQDLAERTTELGKRTLAKELKDLGPQDVADLKVLAGAELELARRLETTQQEMDEAIDPLRQSDPLAADTLADALDEALRLGISGRMRACGAELEQNRIGQALAVEQEIAEGLQEVLDILANRRENELARLVKKLEEAETELAEIDRQQDELRKQIDRNAEQADQQARQQELKRLAARQQALQERAERLARRLERLTAQRAGQMLGQAAAEMGQAGQCAAGGQAGEAGKHAAEAKASLEEARRRLAAQRLEAQAELAMEQLAKLEDAIKHLHRQQDSALAETRRLESLRQEQGQLTRAQAVSLSDLARLERSLEADVVRMGDDLGGSAFSLVLGGAGREMGTAAGLLERLETAEPTQRAEQNALNRLAMVLEALKPEPPDAQQGNAGGNSPGGPKGGQPGGVQTLAELKLLRLLQQEINLRTEELEEAINKGQQLTDQQRQQYDTLAEEQGRLAQLVLKMIQPQDENAEDIPIEQPPDEPEQSPEPELKPPVDQNPMPEEQSP